MTRKSITTSLWTAAIITGAAVVSGDLLAQTTPGPQPSICSRSCWTASASSGCSSLGSLNRAIIHHTASSGQYNTTSLATSKSNVRGTQNYHKNTNGWCDIGYHFLIDKLGNIFEGRYGSLGASGSWRRGAHDGCNSNSMGFSCMGYFHPPYNNAPTTSLRNKMYDVIAWRMPSGWSPYGSSSYCSKTVGRLGSHRNVKATACPGDTLFAHIGNNWSGGTTRNAVAARRTPSGCTETKAVGNQSSAFTASSSWATGTSATDKNGTDYRWRSTAAVSDPAKWTASLSCGGSHTIQAWWTQGSNRSAAAPYIVQRDGGTTTFYANQRVNGGAYRTLGTVNVSSGTRYIQLSCWAATGYVVVADAVRWVK